MTIMDLAFAVRLEEAVTTVTDVFAGPAVMAVPSLDAEGATKLKIPNEPNDMGVLTDHPQDVFAAGIGVMSVPTLAAELDRRTLGMLAGVH